MDPIKIRSMATMLRKKFEGHTETVREIVREMTDTEIASRYLSHEADKLHYARLDAAERVQQNLYARAVEAHS